MTGRGTKTAIQPSSGREGPCVAQAAACGILAAALKARNLIQTDVKGSRVIFTARLVS